MSDGDTDRTSAPTELLYPFYLDTDMSMAFAAALAGGVALEREDVERETQESEAVRNLHGNLRLFGAWVPATVPLARPPRRIGRPARDRSHDGHP